MDTYEEYLVKNSDKKYGEDIIDAITFISFLANFVKGTVEDRVNMYSSFLRRSNDDAILICDLQEVTSHFFVLSVVQSHQTH